MIESYVVYESGQHTGIYDWVQGYASVPTGAIIVAVGDVVGGEILLESNIRNIDLAAVKMVVKELSAQLRVEA